MNKPLGQIAYEAYIAHFGAQGQVLPPYDALPPSIHEGLEIGIKAVIEALSPDFDPNHNHLQSQPL